MKRLRKNGTVLTAVLIWAYLLQTNIAHAGAKIPSTMPSLGLILEENFDLFSIPDVAITMNDQSDTSKSLICSSVDDPPCNEAIRVMIIQHLPVCVEDASFAWISEVWAVDSAGKKTYGTYVS